MITRRVEGFMNPFLQIARDSKMPYIAWKWSDGQNHGYGWMNLEWKHWKTRKPHYLSLDTVKKLTRLLKNKRFLNVFEFYFNPTGGTLKPEQIARYREILEPLGVIDESTM